MSREYHGYSSEMLNLRSFYLRLIHIIWVIPVAMIMGALFATGIYYLATVTYGPARAYSAQSKLYLSFAYDESGKVYDYYNAYTWNDLMSTDDILNQTMKNLANEGIPEISAQEKEKSGNENGISRAEVIASTDAEIPSDGRLMVLTITNHDAKLADAILKATDDSLVTFGSTHDEFEGIDVRSRSDAALVTYTDRTAAAAVTGAVLAAIMAILILLLLDVLDDAVYVPEDCERRYHIPVLGMLPREGSALQERFRNELIAGFEHLIRSQTSVILIAVKDRTENTAAGKALEGIHSTLKNDFDFQKTDIRAGEIPGTGLAGYRKLQQANGVILVLQAGERNGAMTEHLISQLHKHDCPILGIVLTGVWPGFINRYYRI